MVGEIRDQETAQNAVQAALTGHLVFSTLHTNDASTSITRLIDLGIQPFLISSTLIGAMAQRLVRKICEDCKRNRPLTIEEAAMLNLQAPAGQADHRQGRRGLHPLPQHRLLRPHRHLRDPARSTTPSATSSTAAKTS